ncbi:DUF6228 family protein [Micromonospora chersina]|uniref:DUF6228 family protein n=1 Tax=Micromonospora chersina TaxID=47854 RepID=UPI0033A3D181
MSVHPRLEGVAKDRPAGAVVDGLVDGSGHRGWQRDEHRTRPAVRAGRGPRQCGSGRSNGDGVVSWAADLAESYEGWDGVRAWESLEHDLRIDATHDRRGHVNLRLFAGAPRGYDPGAWEASVMVALDAGEDMQRLVAELGDLVS